MKQQALQSPYQQVMDQTLPHDLSLPEINLLVCMLIVQAVHMYQRSRYSIQQQPLSSASSCRSSSVMPCCCLFKVWQQTHSSHVQVLGQEFCFL